MDVHDPLHVAHHHGVLTREAVAAKGSKAGSRGVYPVLRALEERARIRRGYFVDGLGAAQFALAGALDRLRSARDPAPIRPSIGTVHLLAAADPANPYGAALPWPRRGDKDRRPYQRAAGAYVVLVDGSRRCISSEVAPRSTLPAADELTSPGRRPRPGGARQVGRQRELVDPKGGRAALGESPFRSVLLDAGFVAGYAASTAPRHHPVAMPEGDTLFRTAAGLRPHLVGRTVARPGPGAGRRAAGPADRRSRDHRGRGAREEPPHPVRQRARDPDAPADERLVAPLSTGRALAPAGIAGSSRARGRGCGGHLLDAPVVELFESADRDAPCVAGELGPDLLAAGLRRRRGACADCANLPRRPADRGRAARSDAHWPGIGNIYKTEVLWSERVSPFIARSVISMTRRWIV